MKKYNGGRGEQKLFEKFIKYVKAVYYLEDELKALADGRKNCTCTTVEAILGKWIKKAYSL
ncbi:hypothetical protein [Clostridium botulinum]|uniref:hypothetical protein n=1 Tax=Clostridium botulinum TaxID=1491 RepID=UPI0002E8B1B2|nr:hypothetical protein [Clostridium botulinum]MCS4468053.1 hypothetical protein [Clostridium botulinum]MCS4523769.1 hypothetical protein [Clostridium botulinum]